MSGLQCGDLLIGNTLGVYLIEISVAGAYINDATCTLWLYDDDDVVVPGANALAMPYQNTPGKYRGILPDTLALEEDEPYKIVAKAVKAGVGVGKWEATRIAKPRAANNAG